MASVIQFSCCVTLSFFVCLFCCISLNWLKKDVVSCIVTERPPPSPSSPPEIAELLRSVSPDVRWCIVLGFGTRRGEVGGSWGGRGGGGGGWEGRPRLGVKDEEKNKSLAGFSRLHHTPLKMSAVRTECLLPRSIPSIIFSSNTPLLPYTHTHTHALPY